MEDRLGIYDDLDTAPQSQSKGGPRSSSKEVKDALLSAMSKQNSLKEEDLKKKEMELFEEIVTDQKKEGKNAEELGPQYHQLKTEILNLLHAKIKSDNEVVQLKKNICSLYKTAKAEIERKDILLNEANSEMDILRGVLRKHGINDPTLRDTYPDFKREMGSPKGPKEQPSVKNEKCSSPTADKFLRKSPNKLSDSMPSCSNKSDSNANTSKSKKPSIPQLLQSAVSAYEKAQKVALEQLTETFAQYCNDAADNSKKDAVASPSGKNTAVSDDTARNVRQKKFKSDGNRQMTSVEKKKLSDLQTTYQKRKFLQNLNIMDTE